VEPVELLTGNLSVVREHSEGVSLEAFAASAGSVHHITGGAVDLGHCAEVHESGGYLFPCDLQFRPHHHNT